MNRLIGAFFTFVALMGGGFAEGLPLLGVLRNMNPSYGGAEYDLNNHKGRTFVFHHFTVEVC